MTFESPEDGKRAIVVFASRESLPTMRRSIEAANSAASSPGYRVDVVVNGNPLLARSLAEQDDLAGVASLRIWSIPLGDKSNAWSQYFHTIWNGESLAFFMDGYVRPHSDAARLLGDAVLNDPVALGGSGVPSVGRTAKALRQDMLKHSGFHGNFCCIKGNVIAQLRMQQFRLPTGLYRGDSLLGAVLRFGLQPESETWNPKRIYVHGEVSWQTDAKRWWSPADLAGQIRRLRRQARGRLENEAVKHHFLVLRQTPSSLPSTADDLVRQWIAACPQDVRALRRRSLLIGLELDRLARTGPPVDQPAVPQLLREFA